MIAVWQVVVVTSSNSIDPAYKPSFFPLALDCTEGGACNRTDDNCLTPGYMDIPPTSIPPSQRAVFPVLQGRSWVGASASFRLSHRLISNNTRLSIKMCPAGRFNGEAPLPSVCVG